MDMGSQGAARRWEAGERGEQLRRWRHHHGERAGLAEHFFFPMLTVGRSLSFQSTGIEIINSIYRDNHHVLPYHNASM